MAKTGKSNAHLGIHHPFGAKHGTPLAQRPPLAASYAPLAHRLYPRDWRPVSHTLPVADDAPLEERLYPDSIHDVVARHSRGDHSDLQPYTPELHAAVPHYRIGVRPLDIGKAGSFIQQWHVPGRDQHAEHMQFLGNDGTSNFGLMKGGGVGPDAPALFRNYSVLPQKFNKELLDKSFAEWRAEHEQLFRNRRLSPHSNNLSYLHEDPNKNYNTWFNNCEDFVQKIISGAKKYETPDKPLILP